MAVQAAVPTRAVQGGVVVIGVPLGLLAGLEPALALVAALGLAFVVVTMASLTAGLALFAVLTFVDAVLPYESTAGVSFPKLTGALLVLSWLGVVTTGDSERRAATFGHPAFLYVLVLFTGWAAISAAWAEVPGSALEAVGRYAPNAMLFVIVFSAVRRREHALWLVGAFVVGALASAAYGLAVPGDAADLDRLSGASANPNEVAATLAAGAVLAAALAVALRGQPLLRLAATLGVPLSVFAVLLTLSRGGLLALGVALLAAVLMAGRWRPAALAAAAVLAVGAVAYFAAFAPAEARERVTQVDGGTGRADIWTVGWRMVEDEPVQGVGAGNFETSSVHYLLQPGALVRDDFIVDTPKNAHNTYLEILAELGVVGLALFLAVIAFSLTCTLKAVRAFVRAHDRQMEIVARALFVALVAILAADFFGSRQYSKQLWLLLSLGPALLAIARAQIAAGPRLGAAPRG